MNHTPNTDVLFTFYLMYTFIIGMGVYAFIELVVPDKLDK